MNISSIGDITSIDSCVNSNMFNILYCNGKNVDQASVKIAIDLFRSKKRPYAFWIGFEDDPSWLENELLALELVTDETEWAMQCDLNKRTLDPLPSTLDIKQVKDSTGIQDIINVMNGILPSEEHLAIQSFYEQSAPILLSKTSLLTFFLGYENENRSHYHPHFMIKELFRYLM